MLKEFDKIADAHFNAKDSIYRFFRGYLILVTLPLPVLFVILRFSSIPTIGHVPNSAAQHGATHFNSFISLLINFTPTILPLIFILIGCVGFLVMLYISSLHCDSFLYARALNGVRKFFYDFEGRECIRNNYQVLPVTIHAPRLSSMFSPWFANSTFGIIDSFYISFGWYLLTYHSGNETNLSFFVFIGLVMLLCHLVAFWLLCFLLEHQYKKYR